jgi:hypothetical protein
MDSTQFANFRHEAVHQLMRLNKICDQEFQIPTWPRWDYSLESGTLTFSQDGVPKVVALIHVVGSTSKSGGSWLWGWANKNMPSNVVTAVSKVREFGEAENLVELTQPSALDDGYIGWEMTAIAAKLLDAKGAYRCPWENGYVYVVYSSLRFVTEASNAEAGSKRLDCPTHGSGFETFICEHLVSDPAQEWFSEERDDDHRWPDAWCAACDVFFREEGVWNANNEGKTEIKLLCHHCYERLRSQEKSSGPFQ